MSQNFQETYPIEKTTPESQNQDLIPAFVSLTTSRKHRKLSHVKCRSHHITLHVMFLLGIT